MNTRVQTAKLAALAALEAAMNQGLKLDPGTAKALRTLAGRAFRLEIVGPQINIYLLVDPEGVQLRSLYEGHVDTHISGSIADFAELVSAEDPASALINGGISLRGDSAPLFQMLTILQKLNLDWEGALAQWVGDIPAHEVGRTVRNALRWGKQAASSMSRQAEEFLHEESRLLPPAAELALFYSQVQKLGLAVDRLEARLQRQQDRLARLARQQKR